MRRVILLLLTLASSAFTPAAHAPVIAARPLFRSTPHVGDAPLVELPDLRVPAHSVAPPSGPRLEAWARRSTVAALLQPIANARYVMDRGQAMTATLAALPEHRRALGLEGLTIDQMLSPLCESPQLDFEVTHQGQLYQSRYEVEARLWITQPRPSLYALSSTCTDALRASGGRIADAIDNGCTIYDEEAHFPEFSRCRTCLAADGDHARCVASNRCQAERPRSVVANGQVYDVVDAEHLACAPNLTRTMFFLVRDLPDDLTLPRPFDFQSIHYVCQTQWSESAREVRTYCSMPEGTRFPTYGDVLTAKVVHIRRPGSTATPHALRRVYMSEVEIEGTVFAGMTLAGPTGDISVPGHLGGWGMQPNLLRPDGDDVTDPDHTFARDWIATLTLKTATTITGVPISVLNRNTCRDDAWRGPDAQGRYFCLQSHDTDTFSPPYDERWAYDWSAFYYSMDPPTMELRPMVTLAASGLMDPEIPGGHVADVMGSEDLADPDWDNCRWPKTFVPDEMRTFSNEAGVYTHTSQTYRFGKDSRFDVRLALGTSWRRGFCPEGGEP